MDGSGLVPMLLWTEWVSGGGETFRLCFPGGSMRMGQDGSSCLSVWHPDCGSGWGGGASPQAFEALGLT